MISNRYFLVWLDLIHQEMGYIEKVSFFKKNNNSVKRGIVTKILSFGETQENPTRQVQHLNTFSKLSVNSLMAKVSIL